jgi:ubiquinone/menaquinone biosynthesis C-methylase UbiE
VEHVIEAVKLKPGMAVDGLGSGSGYFTRRLVEAGTETGMVYVVDMEPEMLAYVKESIIHSPKLPFGSIDLLFVCNTVHHLEERAKYFRESLVAESALLISTPMNGPESGTPSSKKLTDAGYALLSRASLPATQHFLEFTRSQ